MHTEALTEVLEFKCKFLYRPVYPREFSNKHRQTRLFKYNLDVQSNCQRWENDIRKQMSTYTCIYK